MRNLYYLLKMLRLSLPYKDRKYITILLFIILGFFLFQSIVHAADPNDYRKPNMWQAERVVNDSINRSTVQVDAAKTYPVSTLGADGKPISRTAKSTIKLGANVDSVGKGLFKRSPPAVISFALFALLERTVDWVLDEENNRIKYKDPDGNFGNYTMGDYPDKVRASTPEAVFIKYHNNLGINITPIKEPLSCTAYPAPSRDLFCLVPGRSSGTAVYDLDSGQVEDQYISMDKVAEQVIKDAEAGNAPAMQVMTDTALDMLEAGLLDTALDAASDIPQPDPEEIPDPTTNPNPDPNPEPEPDPNPEPECPAGYTKEPSGTCVKTEQTASDLPPFCSWATKVCDFIDWVKTEPTEPPDGAGDIPIEKPDPDMHVGILERLYINMPAECPPDPVLEFMGAKIPFPMSVFCQFASMMKPLILLFAYIKGLSIIGNGLN